MSYDISDTDLTVDMRLTETLCDGAYYYSEGLDDMEKPTGHTCVKLASRVFHS
jgi:hypothetical protein